MIRVTTKRSNHGQLGADFYSDLRVPPRCANKKAIIYIVLKWKGLIFIKIYCTWHHESLGPFHSSGLQHAIGPLVNYFSAAWSTLRTECKVTRYGFAVPWRVSYPAWAILFMLFVFFLVAFNCVFAFSLFLSLPFPWLYNVVVQACATGPLLTRLISRMPYNSYTPSWVQTKCKEKVSQPKNQHTNANDIDTEAT